jgi:threonyl-tRNA synthetase
MDLQTARHSLSHVLAAAVLDLIPQAKLGIGPAIDDGCYYDFLLPPEAKFTPEVIDKITARMTEIIQADPEFTAESVSLDQARDLFQKTGQDFKIELIDDLEADGATQVSLYRTGDFVDLCRGPHVARAAELKKMGWLLDRVAGAYWRGSEKNPMLQRIYALAFTDKKALKKYLADREEALKRDHRKLGAELDLFFISEEVGKGLPIYLPKGATMRRVLERFVIDEEIKRGYLHVNTPSLGRRYLYDTSGHLAHYAESMYPLMDLNDDQYVLRPMTCPHHFMIYKHKPRSYRDLPMRFAEMATQYRKEQSGELAGLIRVMAFHLADAHIVCRNDQLADEFLGAIDLVQYVMTCLGLTDVISYRASLKDDARDKYVDNPAMWALGEKLLMEMADKAGLQYSVGRGEAAFYGPKLDVQIRNVLGKEDTIFTIQIDFALPERFDLTYMDADGQPARPVVVHRSSIGAVERTLAFLIEYYAGAFPTWLAPVQARVLTVSQDWEEYGARVAEQMKEAGIRLETDFRGETLGKKIREARLQRIGYLVIIGEKEASQGVVSVRNRDTGDQHTLGLDDFTANLAGEDAGKALTLTADQS